MQGPLGEPMSLGSPQSPVSPGGHGQNQYLPAFLMGEPPSIVSSPASARGWPGSGSPPRGTPHNRSSWGPSPSNTMNHSLLAQQNTFTQSPRGDPRTGPRKEKAGAPPVHGLLESIHGSTPSSGRKGPPTLDISQNTSMRQVYTPVLHGMQTPGSTSTPTGPHGHPRKTPPSPAQRDPFYTQGDRLKADDELNETWVTVFGFPPAATSYILQQFSQYGTIMKHVIASDGNWMHIQFQSKFQAKKALSKNGRVFGGSIMVGVTVCIDKSVMVSDNKENADSTTFRTSFIGTPNQASTLQQTINDKMNTSRNTPIRPLTAAYKAATSDHEVIGQSNTPQKSSGFISKTMEYVFGY